MNKVEVRRQSNKQKTPEQVALERGRAYDGLGGSDPRSREACQALEQRLAEDQARK
jgi:hypothetical protein